MEKTPPTLRRLGRRPPLEDQHDALPSSHAPQRCTHANRPNPVRDIFYVLGAVLLLFVLREIVCWFFKTNHGQHELRELRAEVDALRGGGGGG